MLRPFGAGRSDGVNPRVDPRRDLGIQIPPTGSEVDRSDEDPIIRVQRRLDEIVNLVGRLCRLHDPGRVQNLACIFELVDLLFNLLVVLSWRMKVVCDDVEGRCSVHGFSLGLFRAGGRMTADKGKNSRTAGKNSGKLVENSAPDQY